MRPLYLSLLLLAWSCCAVNAQDIISTGKSGADMPVDSVQDTEQLQLTGSIIDRNYCDKDHLKMSIRLNYKNVGWQPLILYKHSIVAPKFMVSRNVKAAEAKKYLKDVSAMVNPILPGPLDINVPGHDSVFVILQPGESYSPVIQTVVHLLYITDGTDIDSNSLGPGDYVIETMVWTWYDSPELAVKLRERWQHLGFLWTKTVKSQPIPFKIDRERNVVNCLEGSVTKII